MFFGIKLYTSNLQYHLWFIYVYIAFLIGLPFLQTIVKGLENKWFFYMMCIGVFFNGILPMAEWILFRGEYSLNGLLKPYWLMENVILYPCVGDFLEKRFEITKKNLIGIWGLNIVGIISSCYLTYAKGIAEMIFSEVQSQTFHSSFVLLNVVCVFITIKYFTEKIKFNKVIKMILCSIGEGTFGIYLLHAWFLDLPMRRWVIDTLVSKGTNYLVATIVLCICVMLLCYIITVILRKIPVLKKIL